MIAGVELICERGNIIMKGMTGAFGAADVQEAAPPWSCRGNHTKVVGVIPYAKNANR